MSKRTKQDAVGLARAVEAKKPIGDELARAKRAADAVTRPDSGSYTSPAVIRETIESVIVAFVLAFIFRTFEAEAFVIPTGSMAPTLMGEHKDVFCPICDYEFQVSASATNRGNGEEVAAVVDTAVCPMCRHSIDLTVNNKTYTSYDGDRILVAKFPYEIGDPKRWDVIVFKYPGNATLNYIKRLIGLPGETIRIKYGDVWIHTAADKDGEFHIARKPPDKILAMLQPVYDNDLASTITAKLGWPARWTSPPGNAGDWQVSKDQTAFHSAGTAQGDAWLRYEHRTPDYKQWKDFEAAGGHVNPNNLPVPRLISDFTAYNTGQSKPPPPIESNLGLHWVGDLALDFTIESDSTLGEVAAELVKGGNRFQCRIDLSTGKATLSILDAQGNVRVLASASTAVKGAGQHEVFFSNVDDELRLWIDRSVVAFDAPTTYDSAMLGTYVPTRLDLQPAGIAANKAKVNIRHIKLLRDLYYISESLAARTPLRRDLPLEDYIDSNPDFTQPDRWPEDFGMQNMRAVEFKMEPPDKEHPEKDQFFAMGDNSAASADGRLWADQDYVDRELLIGKALFIYWPHSWHVVPGTKIPFPFFPNFSRMHFVR